MSIPRIDTDFFINRLEETIDNPDQKFCFVLGAGASVESGIMSGAEMARQWYSELPRFHAPEKIEAWKARVGFDEKNIPAHYSQLFRFRYEGHQQDGIHFITKMIEKGSPGFGYSILSQILKGTGHNVVITTNFDTLTEESLYMFTDKRALVCNHENLAHLARPSQQRPLIVKIHRGLYMDPLNDEDEIQVLKDGWKSVLNLIFQNYISIFIGYAGNDGSLMNFLLEAGPCQRMYWCTRANTVITDDIAKVVARHRGTFVTIDGFNRLMFRFIKLFGVDRMDELIVELAERRKEKLRKEYDEASQEISKTGSAGDKAALQTIAEDFDRKDWLQWQLRAAAVNDPVEKESIYREALLHLPASYQLHNNLGYWLAKWERHMEAITAYRKAIEIKPDYTEAWNNMGASLHNKGNYEEAIASYRKAIESKPDYAEAWNNMGVSLNNQGNYEEAIAAYRKAIELKPDYAETWNNMGVALDDQGNYEEAIAAYRKAIELKPDYANAWYNLGIALNAQGNNDEAIAAYLKANEIKPDYADACNNMGVSLENQGNYDEAIAAYQKAIGLRPEVALFWANASGAYKHLKDLKNARTYLEKAIELDPLNEEYKKSLQELNNNMEK